MLLMIKFSFVSFSGILTLGNLDFVYVSCNDGVCSGCRNTKPLRDRPFTIIFPATGFHINSQLIFSTRLCVCVCVCLSQCRATVKHRFPQQQNCRQFYESASSLLSLFSYQSLPPFTALYGR